MLLRVDSTSALLPTCDDRPDALLPQQTIKRLDVDFPDLTHLGFVGAEILAVHLVHRAVCLGRGEIVTFT